MPTGVLQAAGLARTSGLGPPAGRRDGPAGDAERRGRGVLRHCPERVPGAPHTPSGRRPSDAGPVNVTRPARPRGAGQVAPADEVRNETFLFQGAQPPLTLLGAKRITQQMARRHPGGPSRFRPVFKGFCAACPARPGRTLGRAPPPNAPFRPGISLFRPEISVSLGQPPSASKAT